jgi:hypothetical protein
MVSTGSPSRETSPRGDQDRRQRAGNAAGDPGPDDHDQQGQPGEAGGERIDPVQMRPHYPQLAQHIAGKRVQTHAEKGGQLGDGDKDGDAGGEADNERIGQILDDRAQAAHPHQHQQPARHQRGDGQAGHAVLLHNPVHDHNEGAGGAADLHAAAAERGDDEARHYGGIQALFGRDAGSDAEGDGQRQRDDAGDEPGNQVIPQLLGGIARTIAGEGLRKEEGVHTVTSLKAPPAAAMESVTGKRIAEAAGLCYQISSRLVRRTVRRGIHPCP